MVKIIVKTFSIIEFLGRLFVGLAALIPYGHILGGVRPDAIAGIVIFFVVMLWVLNSFMSIDLLRRGGLVWEVKTDGIIMDEPLTKIPKLKGKI